ASTQEKQPRAGPAQGCHSDRKRNAGSGGPPPSHLKSLQQLGGKRPRQLPDRNPDIADARQLHSRTLLLRYCGIGVNTEHEREKSIEESLHVLIRHPGEKLLQAVGHGQQGAAIRLLERHQIFDPAVGLHIIVIHGHQLQQPLPPLQCAGQLVGESIHGQLPVSAAQGV
ncbi:DUF2004 domain-containing protein, partial [Dysosmobacter welbionis]